MLTVKLIAKYLLLSLCLCNAAPPTKKPRYTEAEEKIIFNELLKYSVDDNYISGKDMWLKIAEKLREMRKSSCPFAFPADRKPAALIKHFQVKMRKAKGLGPLPDFFFENPFVRKRGRGKSSDIQQNLEDKGKDKTSSSSKTWIRYTLEEDKFLINEVLSYPHRPVPINNLHMWSEVAERLNKKRKEHPEQFPCERSAATLRSHFRYVFKSKVTGHTQERDDLVQAVTAGENEDVVKFKFWKRFTKEEDDFITRALLHPDCTSMYRQSDWETIKEKHDKELLSKTPGFFHERSADSLRTRFLKITLKKGAVPQPLIEKFPQQFTERAASEIASQIEEREEEEIVEDENAIWTSMIEELQDNDADFEIINL